MQRIYSISILKIVLNKITSKCNVKSKIIFVSLDSIKKNILNVCVLNLFGISTMFRTSTLSDTCLPKLKAICQT